MYYVEIILFKSSLKVRQKFIVHKICFFFSCLKENLTHFVSSNQKISLFLPLPRREKSFWPEKAHSSLCSLTMNLDNSCKKRNTGINGCFHCYVEYKYIPYINSGAIPVFLFLFYGSPSPIVGNKDKMGGSAL